MPAFHEGADAAPKKVCVVGGGGGGACEHGDFGVSLGFGGGCDVCGCDGGCDGDGGAFAFLASFSRLTATTMMRPSAPATALVMAL